MLKLFLHYYSDVPTYSFCIIVNGKNLFKTDGEYNGEICIDFEANKDNLNCIEIIHSPLVFKPNNNESNVLKKIVSTALTAVICGISLNQRDIIAWNYKTTLKTVLSKNSLHVDYRAISQEKFALIDITNHSLDDIEVFSVYEVNQNYLNDYFAEHHKLNTYRNCFLTCLFGLLLFIGIFSTNLTTIIFSAVLLLLFFSLYIIEEKLLKQEKHKYSTQKSIQKHYILKGNKK